MHIVTTTDSAITLVPRAFETSVSVVITDEETNTSTTESLTATRDVNYLVIDPAYTFVEGRYYTIKVTGTDELYRGKVYCTNQTDLEKFSINNGEFTYYEEGTDNQYIYR